jgi:hypothetical protein
MTLEIQALAQNWGELNRFLIPTLAPPVNILLMIIVFRWISQLE